VAHKETPGLGDYIEATKSNWIKGFDGKKLGEHADRDWQVKKDGGQFDYLAGATITPRAVVKAVHKALEFYTAHRQELFAPTSATTQPAKEQP
jgi:electron transport complex protein RnfG